MPSDWKSDHISAIYKEDSKQKAENYHPVSLTSVAVKMAESVIKERITSHMVKNKLFSDKQFGVFFNGKSIVLQLLVKLCGICLISVKI